MQRHVVSKEHVQSGVLLYVCEFIMYILELFNWDEAGVQNIWCNNVTTHAPDRRNFHTHLTLINISMTKTVLLIF